jgi:hypothetical protein
MSRMASLLAVHIICGGRDGANSFRNEQRVLIDSRKKDLDTFLARRSISRDRIVYDASKTRQDAL